MASIHPGLSENECGSFGGARGNNSVYSNSGSTDDDENLEIDEQEPQTDDGGVDEEEDDEQEDDSEVAASDDDDKSTASTEGIDIWREVIQDLVESNKEEMQPSTNMVKTSKLVKVIMEKVEWHLGMADAIRATGVYKQIFKTEMKLRKQGYGDDEATTAAWKMRQFLVEKEIIHPNIDLLDDSQNEDEELQEDDNNNW